MSLATKYRPQTFEDVCGQETIITILNNQLKLEQPCNCYLFAGSSGVGKTTLARIFAHKLNGDDNSPIMEVDGASNNGVDNIRSIIDISNQRSITSKYNIILIDECHMITTAGWNAFLKTLEEPSPHSIFLLCTTDPQKIPSTILNRVMRLNLNRLSTEDIANRLKYISKCEGYTNYEEACNYIAELALGGMRDAIVMLEKCSMSSNDLSITNLFNSIGYVSYEDMFTITNALLDKKADTLVTTIDNLYNNGYDLVLFMHEYVDFLLDVNKYCIFKSIDYTKIPHVYNNSLNYLVDTNNEQCTKYFNKLMNDMLKLYNNIKGDKYYKDTITITLLSYCK